MGAQPVLDITLYNLDKELNSSILADFSVFIHGFTKKIEIEFVKILPGPALCSRVQKKNS